MDLLLALNLTSSPSTRATFSPFVTYTGFWHRHTSDLHAEELWQKNNLTSDLRRIVTLQKGWFYLSVKKRKPSSDFSWSSLLSSHFPYTSLKNSWWPKTTWVMGISPCESIQLHTLSLYMFPRSTFSSFFSSSVATSNRKIPWFLIFSDVFCPLNLF